MQAFLDFSASKHHISQCMNKELTFFTSDQEKLDITFYWNKEFFKGNTIIFVHGFKGFKDWGFVPYLGNYLADKGFVVITFNFSHNGIGSKKDEFTEFDKFAKNTFSREVRELNELISAVRNGFFEEIGINSNIGLLGHSRGGAVALLSASKRNDIKAIVTWAAIAKLDRYSERQKAEWRKNGFFEVMNTRTNQMMRLNVDLLNDIEVNSKGSLNIQDALQKIECPLLIAHGNQDMAVSIKEADQLYEWSQKSNTEYYKIYSTGHTFDIVHPFAGSNDKFDKLLEKTANFFNQNIN
jgi:uncharacterized protein